jgi:hypothetical protein
MRLSQVCAFSACVWAVSAPAVAQGPVVGVEAGVNFTTIDFGVSGQSNDSRSGLILGIYGQVPIAPRIGLQPEFVYTQKHARQRFTTCNSAPSNPFLRDSSQPTTCPSGTTTITQTEGLDYLGIPILLRISLTGDRKPAIYAIAGPALSFLVRAKGAVTGQPQQDIKDDSASVDVNVVLGGGGVAIRSLSVEGRYDVGLRTVDKHTAFGDPSVTTGALTVLGRVHF